MKISAKDTQPYTGIYKINNTCRAVSIPIYQRPYTWKSEQIRNLISDAQTYIVQAQQQENKNYFAGAIVSVCRENDNNDKTIQLIDGQQRYTTLFLINFMSFLICRNLIRQKLSENKLEQPMFKKLSNITEGVFAYNCDKGQAIQKFNSDIKRLSEADDNFDGYVKENKDSLLEALGYCVHEEEIQNNLSNFLQDSELLIQYARASSNKYIKMSLGFFDVVFDNDRFAFLEFDCNVQDEPKNTETVDIYVEAFKSIYCALAEQIYLETPALVIANSNKFDEYRDLKVKALKLLNTIETFLENVHICNIVSGDEMDAYMLFEVLNDRAAPLSDLDLVKNRFIRGFVQSHEEVPTENVETGVDDVIAKYDQLYWEAAFQQSLGGLRDKVLFLGTFFITGNKQVSDKNRDKAAMRNFVGECLDDISDGRYEKQLFCKHWQSYWVVSTILNETLKNTLKSSKAKFNAYLNKQEISHFKLACMYFNMKNQSKVMSILILASVRKYFQNRNEINEDTLQELVA